MTNFEGPCVRSTSRRIQPAEIIGPQVVRETSLPRRVYGNSLQ